MQQLDVAMSPATEKLRRPGAISRRDFLGTAGGAALAAALASTGAAIGAPYTVTSRATAAAGAMCTGVVPRSKLGYQLYTSAALWLTDMPACLQLLASIGYTSVERFAGYGGLVSPSGGSVSATPQQFKQQLNANGLWCSGGHDNGLWPYDATQFKQTVEGAQIIGQPYIGANPTSYPTTVTGCKQFAETMYKELAIARSMGFKGSIYTHFDFGSLQPLTDDRSQRAINVILENTTRDVWNPQLDTEHALQQLGSIAAVLALVRKYPGRFSLIHMKDGTAPVQVPGNPADTEYSGAATEFGYGDWGRADPSDPKGRPHAGFQDLLAVLAETQDWNDVLLIAESDGSPSGADYGTLYYRGMNGLRFRYTPRQGSGCLGSSATKPPTKGNTHHTHHTHQTHHKKRKKRRKSRRAHHSVRPDDSGETLTQPRFSG